MKNEKQRNEEVDRVDEVDKVDKGKARQKSVMESKKFRELNFIARLYCSSPPAGGRPGGGRL
jgi:hypothetical protein